MKKLVIASLAALAVGTVAFAQSVNGEAQLNVPTSYGTVTLYRVGGTWNVYIGNGQPLVWTGSQAEFQKWTRAACGAAQAFEP